ncbi:MAG: ATP-binding protein [Acidobacteriota bacterium]|nr:ATP-binding protein [Acidobacteriota bacterium]
MSEEPLEHALTSLLRISEKLNSTFDLHSLLDTLVEQLLELTGADSGCAGMRTGQGMSCDNFLHEKSSVPLTHFGKPETGWAGWVLMHGTSYLTNDALSDRVILPEVRERFGVKSGLCVPIIDSRKDVIAFFEVYNKKSGAGFTPNDLRSGIAAAQIASLAIQNSLTYSRLNALAAFSRSLTLAGDLEQVLETVGHHLESNFHCGSAVLLPADQGLVFRYKTPEFVSTAKELEAAIWCWENGQEAGASTAQLADARAHYLPLTLAGRVVGVLGLEIGTGALFSSSQRELLGGFIGQSALAIERAVVEQKLRRLRFLDELDRVQSALLTAVAHEVRAPLSAITAVVSSMLNSSYPLGQEQERQLLQTAECEAKRLHRLMNNLLNVTRLQTGIWRVRIEPSDLLDVVGAALEEMGTHKRQLSIDIPPDLPLVPMDFELITQVLVNLFSNAFRFSSAEQRIELRSQIVNDNLEVKVLDRGRGVPDGDLNRVFEKFHRLAESTSVDGLGLGLSICKEFVEAHRGRITLEHNPGGGTVARFVLPLQTSIV